MDLEPDIEQVWQQYMEGWVVMPDTDFRLKELASLTRATLKTLASRHDLLVHELIEKGIEVSE